MFDIGDKKYREVCKKECNDEAREAVKVILSRNIVCGNALTLKCVDENGVETSEPIVFSEWAFITGDLMQRCDYTFADLLAGEVVRDRAQISLFDQDEGGTFLKRYISDYRRVQQNGEAV